MTANAIARRIALACMLAASLALTPLFAGCAAKQGAGEGDAPLPDSTQGSEAGANADEAAAAYEKAEIIYATLGGSGALEAVYAINRFDVKAAGTIVDRGAYGNVAALSDTGTISRNGENTEIAAEEGVFYYQGDAGAMDLPWNISLEYRLDGRSVSPEELGGATGALEIAIATSRNEAVAESAFYDSFMLQLTFTMPTQAARDIQAEGATIAAAGRNTTVAFAVLPGSDANLTLAAQVEDFSMDGVQIAALPYSQAIEMPDTGEMVGGMEALSSGVNALSDGAAQLAAGAAQLAAGSAEFGSGLETLASSGQQLTEASAAIAEALQSVSDALAGLDLDSAGQIEQLPGILRTAADSLEAQADAAHGTYLAFTQAESSLASAMEALRQEMTLSSEEIEGALAAVEGTEAHAAVQTLADSYAAAQAALAAYDAAAPAFSETEALLETIGGDEAVATARAQAELMRKAADLLEEGGDESLIARIQELVDGLSEMAEQFAAFHDGVAQFAGGVQQISDNHPALQSGAAELASGAASLSQGLGALAASVALIPDAMTEQIDAMMEEFAFPPFEPVSFMSSENKNVTQVQFVMATPAIKAPAAPEEPEAEQPEPTIFDRVLALFS